jgi:hypothetical protein
VEQLWCFWLRNAGVTWFFGVFRNGVFELETRKMARKKCHSVVSGPKLNVSPYSLSNLCSLVDSLIFRGDFYGRNEHWQICRAGASRSRGG